MRLTARLDSQARTVSFCDAVLVLGVDVVVLIITMITRVLFGQSRKEAAVKAELNKGLQDWEAGAGDAD